MQALSFSKISERSLFLLLAFTILWRGGKSIESTWLLALIAASITLWYCGCRLLRSKKDVQDPVLQSDAPWQLSALVLLYVLWTVASYILSSTQNYGLDEVLRTTSCGFVFLWAARLASDKERRGTFLLTFSKILALTTVIACIVGIAIYIFQPVNRFVGTFFDYRFTTDYWPNAWADFLLLVCPISLIWRRAFQRSAPASFYATNLMLGLFLGSLLLSYSRGAILAFILQIILFLLLAIQRRESRTMVYFFRTLRSVCTIVVIAVVLFFVANTLRSQYHDVQSVGEKITFTASEGSSSVDERRSFWGQALQLSFDHALFGYGPYSFRFVQPRLATSVLATSDHPHNLFLKAAMELGWPACALLIAIILFSLKPVFRSIVSVSKETRSMTPELLLFISILGVLAHNMIDYNLQFVAVGLPFWMILGVLSVTNAPSVDGKNSSFSQWNRVRFFLKIEAVLAFLLLIITLVEGEQLFISSLGRHAEQAGQPQQALQWYHSAQAELFSRDMHLSEAQLFINLGDLPAAQDAVEMYMKQNQEDARAWALLALIQNQRGRPVDASAAIDKAYDLGKYTDLGILDLLLKIEDNPLAKKDLRSRKLEFDALFSKYDVAIEHNTHFIDLSPAVEHLLSVSRKLSQLFPTDADRYRAIARHAYTHAMEVRSQQTAKSTGLLW